MKEANDSRAMLNGNKIMPSLVIDDIEKKPSTNDNQTFAGGKKIIRCLRVKRQELDDGERVYMRIFYWAAFFGMNRYLKLMIETLKWSPFIKSFRNRSILSAAILGGQIDTVRFLLNGYSFVSVMGGNDDNLVLKTVFNKDVNDNNSMHFAYLKN